VDRVIPAANISVHERWTPNIGGRSKLFSFPVERWASSCCHITMQKHPLVERYFPEYPQHKLEELAADIKENKQKLPVITYQDKILDGWNRWRAMRLLGWNEAQMRFVAFPGNDEQALAFVFSLNFYRRHQSSTDLNTMMQLMLSARKAEPAKVGRPPKNEPQVTQAQVAEAAGVSERTVRRRIAEAKAEIRPDGLIKDPFGHELPPVALAYWNRRKEVQDLVKLAKQLAGKIKKLSRDDPMYRRVSLQALETKANAVAFDFKMSLPYCLCPNCLGQDPENCRLCDGRGLVTQVTYEQGVPKETREAFEKSNL
jgi:ParB-like chromosome segregation protein Spo0J